MAFALDLPGTTGHYASTPDAAAFDITGDIDLIAYVALDDWTPGTAPAVLSLQGDAGSPNRRCKLIVATTSALTFQWFPTGSLASAITSSSTLTTGFTDGTGHWIRVTLDVNNGAAGNDVKFYTSNDAPTTAPASVTWAQLGTTVTTAGTTSMPNVVAGIQVGAETLGTSQIMAGLVHRAEVRNGIDGTVVASPSFDRSPARPQGMLLTGMGGTNSFIDAQGNVWTVNGGNSKFVAV